MPHTGDTKEGVNFTLAILISVSDGLVFLSEETKVVAEILIFKIGDEVPQTAVFNNSKEGGS